MDRALDEVFNQSGELNGYNLFSTHSALVDAPAAFGRLPPGSDHEALLARCCTPHSP